MRTITQTYSDPVDLIWIDAARQMGMRIERSAEVNASWDGQGCLTIGTPETLDPDDSLAQMILHEACHALIEGPESLGKVDWGLESFNPAKRVREHATLRLQAALADQYGMRTFFASTTMFRSYYDRIPDSPLADDGDPAVPLAREAWESAKYGSWAAALDTALSRTAAIAQILQDVATTSSLWSSTLSPPVSQITDG